MEAVKDWQQQQIIDRTGWKQNNESKQIYLLYFAAGISRGNPTG